MLCTEMEIFYHFNLSLLLVFLNSFLYYKKPKLNTLLYIFKLYGLLTFKVL
jgi:hypothetical protein